MSKKVIILSILSPPPSSHEPYYPSPHEPHHPPPSSPGVIVGVRVFAGRAGQRRRQNPPQTFWQIQPFRPELTTYLPHIHSIIFKTLFKYRHRRSVDSAIFRFNSVHRNMLSYRCSENFGNSEEVRIRCQRLLRFEDQNRACEN